MIAAIKAAGFTTQKATGYYNLYRNNDYYKTSGSGGNSYAYGMSNQKQVDKAGYFLANYNSDGQIVISGEDAAVEEAMAKALEAGSRKAVKLNVSGAFHSPLMQPAREELAKAIESTPILAPRCPVYQNVSTQGEQDPEVIKTNLIAQLTAPVRWTQSVQQMIADGATHFIELGPGKVLQGLVAKIDKSVTVEGQQ